MTKEITKAIILQEMQDKLHLREFEPANFLFDETVVAIYNIEQHLRKQSTLRYIKSITSAAGFIFCTVPANEKWRLNRYTVIFTGAGAIKVSGLYFTRAHQASYAMYLDLTKNQIVSYAIDLPKAVVLNGGDTIGVLCDDYTSTQDLQLFLDVEKEEVR